MANSMTDRPARPVRLVDIAREAGVSRTAVANVVLGSAGSNVRVSEETAKRIRDVARHLGYAPNAAAQRLAGKRSKLIGVIIDSYAPAPSFKQLSEMERICDDRGYRIIIGQSHGELGKIKAYAKDFIANGVDGAVCISHDYPDIGQNVAKVFMKIPKVVFIGRPLAQSRSACWVAVDHSWGSRSLVRHMVERGHRRVALFITEAPYTSVEARVQGFLDEAEASGLGLDNGYVVRWESDVWDWQRVVDTERLTARLKEILDRLPIDGILAENDYMALQLVRSLRNLGLSVPDDIAVAGYDNIPLSNVSIPSITTVDTRDREVAQRGLDMLLSMIEDNDLPLEERHQLVRPELAIRESA